MFCANCDQPTSLCLRLLRLDSMCPVRMSTAWSATVRGRSSSVRNGTAAIYSKLKTFTIRLLCTDKSLLSVLTEVHRSVGRRKVRRKPTLVKLKTVGSITSRYMILKERSILSHFILCLVSQIIFKFVCIS